MKCLLPLLVLALVALLAPARAVLNDGSYLTTEPTGSDVTNWTTGWNLGAGITGWDYVGQVNGASGVYLGNGWVLTAGHVGAGNFTLDGASYSMVSGSTHTFTTTAGGTTGTADLALFQIATSPNLAALTLSSSVPLPNFSKTTMIGYGGGQGETWGYNTVTDRNVAVPVSGFYSIDFATAYGSPSTNLSHVVGGDSGGAAFIYSGGSWKLAGILEAIDLATNDSYMVQLSSYYSAITTLTSVPEPDLASWMGALAALLPVLARLRGSRRTACRTRRSLNED